jgi:putative GTP pyrophosphokinase
VTSQKPLPSKGTIDRAGAYLVAVSNGTTVLDGHEYLAAYEILDAFRAEHQRPMTRVAKGLRSIVRTATRVEPVVSQRLKRSPRIVRKLKKMGKSNLARLEDIGGCRAVVQNLTELEAVRQRIERVWHQRYGQIRRRRDYIADVPDSGYRAVHWVVERAGRRIEVQLRTNLQQQWANAVESADARLGLTLKDGVGPKSMLEYFRTLGDYIYSIDNDMTDSTLRDRLTAAEDKVIAEGFYAGRATA